MRNPTTLSSIKPTPGTPLPMVRVRAFDSRGRRWKGEASDWLNDMRAQGFACKEGHTLRVRKGVLSAEFVIFVVRKVRGPIKPLPRICFAHYEVGSPGHAIGIDLSVSPPETTIYHHLWQGCERQGKTPHFERHVEPCSTSTTFSHRIASPRNRTQTEYLPH